MFKKIKYLANVSRLAAHIGSGDYDEISFFIDILREMTFLPSMSINYSIFFFFFFQIKKRNWSISSGVLELTVSLEMRAPGEKRLRIGWRPSQMSKCCPNEGRQKPPAKLTWANEQTTSSWQTMSRNLYSELMSARMVANRSSKTLSNNTQKRLEPSTRHWQPNWHRNVSWVAGESETHLHVGNFLDILLNSFDALIRHEKMLRRKCNVITVSLYLLLLEEMKDKRWETHRHKGQNRVRRGRKYNISYCSSSSNRQARR